MKIYLGSPYTHQSLEVMHERYVAACKKAAEIMQRGHLVYSPIAHSHGIALYGGLPPNYEHYRLIDMEMIRWSDEVRFYKLPGWENSNGMQQEYAFCMLICKPVNFID